MSARAPLLAAALAAPFAGGCHTFRPVEPLRGSDGQAALEAVALRFSAPPLGEEAVLVLDVVRTDRRRLAEARLSALSEPECRGGVAARRVSLRGASGHELPTRALGEARSVDLVFGRDDLSGALGREPSFVDLRLLPEAQDGPESCVRLPLVPTPGQVAWVERPLWDLGAGARFLWLPRSSHGLRWGWVVAGWGGVFLGAVRVGVEAGGGGGEPDAPAAGRSFALYGGALRLDGLLASLRAGKAGRLGLEGQVGYDLWLAEGQRDYLGTALGTGARWAFHGPRAGLRFAFLPAAPDWSGFFGRRDASGMGLELHLARWWSPGAGPAWVLGLGLGGHLAL